ncbi:MAG: 2,3-bisphosphoglycerate-independent phosphoglycerate mutase [Pirellulaceae bacterium]|jgi:2,3-bisphosphoglycerate-independent phosphoglycerate mutase
MKYAIVIPDGCADEPQESLGGKTPMQAANTPAMDAIAAAGIVGRSNNVPAHLPAGSAVANMSLLGYDPIRHFSGRAPLEAAAQGIELGPNDWAIRCNLVTIQDQIMNDFTADHISTDDAKLLLAAAQEKLGTDYLEFVAGVSYRNLLLFRGEKTKPPFTNETRSTPPHDLTDKSVADDFPRGPGSDFLNELMSESVSLFADHEVNAARVAAGKLPATNIWLWGLGKTPQLEAFQSVYHKTGKMITAVDLLRGIASLIGWDRIEVPGATGYTDTDYAAKGQYAIDAIPSTDIICVHVEATDEASHEGDLEAKVKALEAIDEQIVSPLLAALQDQGDYRILVSPDHPTPLRTKTHSHGFVPWAIAGTGVEADELSTYDEVAAGQSSHAFDEGWKLMGFFLQ